MNEPIDHEIDITIEAVTGTVYDLCVSPFETILGIKTKIQRLEGIPVFHQHLIYGDTELQDEYCLEEYNIRSGCQLKLIITLRGGPVHAHRVQLEDSALLELAEYLDIQPGDEQEQYMFMLLNDSNVELINTDGGRSQLQSPVELSESRASGGSQTSLLAPSTTLPNAVTVVENMNTKDKMRDLQSKLKSLRLNRAEHQVPKKSSNFKRKCAAKVIILDSRASSRIHVSPTPVTPPQPSSHMCSNPSTQCCMCSCQHHCHHCHNVSAKSQRKLIFRAHPPEFSMKTVDRMKGNRTTVSRESCSQRKLLAGIAEQVPQPPPGPSTHFNSSNRRRKLKPISSHNSFTSSIEQDPVLTSSTRGLPGATCKEVSSHKRSVTTKNKDDHYLPPLINKRSILEMNNPEIYQKSLTGKKNRCMKCGKKTRIAATYTCRCGGMFCGAHRYAEAHSCTHDYKAEGKATIARNNPLVVATKLPKI